MESAFQEILEEQILCWAVWENHTVKQSLKFEPQKFTKGTRYMWSWFQNLLAIPARAYSVLVSEPKRDYK